MRHWTARRKISLAVHTGFVAIPFTISTVSAFLFWQAMFGDWPLAAAMVAVVEVLALTGLILHLTCVPSPFQGLRHALPFISIVPLGLELYGMLAHNGLWVAIPLTGVVVAILVLIAWQCFRTIERLFVDPVGAAREKAKEQLGGFSLTLAQLDEMNAVIDGFVVDRMRYHAPSLVAPQVAYPDPVLVQTKTTKAIAGQAYECPKCGRELSLGAYGAAKRHGHCNACKEGTQ